MKTILQKIKNLKLLPEAVITASLGFLMIIQRFLAGTYKPVMDDWFLYGDLYAKLFGRLKYFAAPNDKFAIRPAAGFFDCFVTAPLFKHLWLVELILTLSLLIGAVLIIKTLRKNNAAGAGFFLCFVCLFPLALEATYWVAAATRVCYSTLFIGAAVYSLDWYYRAKRKTAVWLFAVFGMIAVCFYEPAIVMYILLVLFVITARKREKRDYFTVTILAAQIAIIGIYYILNSGTGEIESRGGLLNANVIEHTKTVFGYTKKIFGSYARALMANGFKKGYLIVTGGHGFIKCFTIACLSVLFGASASHCVKKRSFSVRLFIFAVILILGGVSLNFVLGSDRIPLRLVYFSFLGIGLAADELLALLPYQVNKAVTAIALSCIAFVFTVTGVGEVRDYQTTSDYDVYITQQIIDLDVNGDVTNIDRNTYVFGGQHSYIESRCIGYLDHVRGASGNYADITGCMQHLTGRAWTNNIVPFTYGDVQILKPFIDLEGVCSYYYIEFDKTVGRASLVPDGENFIVVREDGSYIGRLEKVDDVRYQYFDD